MNITESDVALWLIDRARKGLTGTADMGALERIVEQVSRESRRRALENEAASINNMDSFLFLWHCSWHGNRRTIGIETEGFAAASG